MPTTKVEQYADAKRKYELAAKWANMIGCKYTGGGGGIGRIHSLNLQATVYFQESDGANNYHDCPEDLQLALAEAAQDHFGTILQTALAKMNETRRLLAKEATDEHGRLMQAAGLDLPRHI